MDGLALIEALRSKKVQPPVLILSARHTVDDRVKGLQADGYILTNNHVVEQSARIKVELSDRRVLDAKLIGADEPSDLAVIKIDAINLPVVAIGDSTAMRVSDVAPRRRLG